MRKMLVPLVVVTVLGAGAATPVSAATSAETAADVITVDAGQQLGPLT
jgi:hypothetical protein